MWEPLARALGWPKKPLGFADVLSLATTNAELGRLREADLRVVPPRAHEPGLLDVRPRVRRGAVLQRRREALRADGGAGQEQGGARQGGCDRALDRPLRRHDALLRGPAEEVRPDVRLGGRDGGDDAPRLQPHDARSGMPKLVAIYPREGTFVSDSPFMILNAPWVTADQKAAAQDFHDWLLHERSRRRWRRSTGSAPAIPKLKPVAPITAANGVDPAQPKRLLALPDPRVLARIKAAWHADRKPANIMLVVDVSGSMKDREQARAGEAGPAGVPQAAVPAGPGRAHLLRRRRSTPGCPIAPFKADHAALAVARRRPPAGRQHRALRRGRRRATRRSTR